MERNIKMSPEVVGKIKSITRDVTNLQGQISLNLNFVGASREYCNEKIDRAINELEGLKRQLKAIEKLNKMS